MMKLLFTILSLTAIKANATTYYVSTAGSDAANGTSTGTSWQTISKVNGFTFAANDSILFKRGDTWNDTLTRKNYVNYDAYGVGNMPNITGFQTVTGFTQSGNVWSATATNAVNNLNCVLLNGRLAIKARTPNTSWSLFTTWQGDSLISGTPETGTPSRVGKSIVVRTSTYIIDTAIVTSQATSQLIFFPKATVNLGNFGRGYFFQNDSSFVDTLNEFSFAGINKRISVYSTTSPNVQVATFDTLVRLGKGSTFRNIKLTGANKLLIQLTGDSSTMKNDSLQYSGRDAVQGDGISRVIIDSNKIRDAWNDGIILDWITQRHRDTITNNIIRRVGMAAGMGGNSVGTYTAMLFFPDSTLAQYNDIDSVGYIGIHFSSTQTKILNNHVEHACLIKVDCGSIYTFQGATGNLIQGNIAGNNPGNPDGITGNNLVPAFYSDDYTVGQLWNGNTGFNCKTATFLAHAGVSANVYTNNLSDDSIGSPFSNVGTPNLTSKYNIWYSRDAATAPYTTDNNTAQTTDSNWYLRPTAAFTYPTDTHAMYMPTRANANIAGTLFINPTRSDSTITFNQAKTYVDIKTGKLYAGTMILHPYETVELFESTLGMLPIYVNKIK